jgi:processive 1,2-diacylglycerol beta-glucosyltransferase
MKKILIVSIVSGLGHLRAAQAVEKALKARPGKVKVKHVNVLDYLPDFYGMAFNTGYTFLTKNFPQIYSFMYEQTNKYPWPKNYVKQTQWLARHSRKFLRLISEFDPDIIVSTHYLPTQILSEYKRYFSLRAALVAIVTDYNIHAYLIQNLVDAYILPDLSLAAQLRKCGFKNTIKTFGIPTDPDVKKNINKEKTKSELGLFPRQKTVTIMCSNYRITLLRRLFSALSKVTEPFQVIATTGRNTGVLRTVNRIRKNYKFPVLAVGHTDRIYDLMKVSDVIITKPGGLTVAELLICGIPMVLLNPIPGQEEKNADMLVKAGAAFKLKLNEIRRLPHIIQEILTNEKRSALLRKNALNLARPDATKMIADFLLKL